MSGGGCVLATSGGFRLFSYSIEGFPVTFPEGVVVMKYFLVSLKKIVLVFVRSPINSVRGLGPFLRDLLFFRRIGGKISAIYPFFLDYSAEAGTVLGHYFHQDLLVASYIHQRAPFRHIDVGSRLDGFVAHVATFRVIEVLDIRELRDTGHENIRFRKADLMKDDGSLVQITDSVSCLHAIEHFGLGRYGDAVDPMGHVKAFNILLKMIKPGGMLYISFPIGTRAEVHFNAHRIFHPQDILSWGEAGTNFDVVRFDYVDDQGAVHQKVDLNSFVPQMKFGCGVYSIRKGA